MDGRMDGWMDGEGEEERKCREGKKVGEWE